MHMVAGVLEFFTATMAIWLARRSDPEGRTLPGPGRARPAARADRGLSRCSGIAYFLDQMGSLVEPAFFLMFSAMVAAELVGARRRGGQRRRAESSPMRDEVRRPSSVWAGGILAQPSARPAGSSSSAVT